MASGHCHKVRNLKKISIKKTGEEILTYKIKTQEENVCPICGGHFYVIGSRNRKMINAEGNWLVLIIRRLRCKRCNKIHHELPECLIPYKRHCCETIEKIIEGDIKRVPCDDRTIHKIKSWWITMRPYFLMVLASLSEKYGVSYNVASTPKEIVRAAVNTNLWIHTRSLVLSG